MKNEIKIFNDDNALDIIDKINILLSQVGFVLVTDDAVHDGFEVVTLIRDADQ